MEEACTRRGRMERSSEAGQDSQRAVALSDGDDEFKTM